MAGSGNLNPIINWFVVASQRGGHQAHQTKRSKPGRALYYLTLPGTDQLVGVVVCDGASSAEEGRAGAQTAASAALEWAWWNNGKKPGQDLTSLLIWTVEAARETVVHVAKKSSIPLREYAATLTIFAQVDGLAATAQIGDGLAWSAPTQAGC